MTAGIEALGLHEAEITIGTERLSFGQSMAVRVAIEFYMMHLAQPDFAAEMGETGRA